jgi:hypothetical protein
LKKRIFVNEYVGLSTRLEALALAFMVSDYYGHEVCIDWKELDALNIVGATVRGRGLAGRLGAHKLRENAPPEAFHRIARHASVNLRTHHGPPHLLQRYYLPTAQRVKLRPDLIEAIRTGFAPYAGRPLVGVHIRRGDFPLMSPTEFDANAFYWPATPDWWYEHVMAAIRDAVPDVAFYVSCSGSLADLPALTRQFDVFEIETRSTYGYRRPGHESVRHPAADLFALACCSTLIGSSCSTFTHYAANMLGEPTTVLVPPPRTHQQAPEYCRIDMHGRGASDWYAACRQGTGLVPVTDAHTLPIRPGARVDWM